MTPTKKIEAEEAAGTTTGQLPRSSIINTRIATGEKTIEERVNDLLKDGPPFKWDRKVFMASCAGVGIPEMAANDLAENLNCLSNWSETLLVIPINLQLMWLPRYQKGITPIEVAVPPGPNTSQH